MRRQRLAVIELTCPHCKQETRASLPDDIKERGPEPSITCRECGKEFKFKKGMWFHPVGTTYAWVEDG
jgi:transcription elongation factor Elf1